MTARATTPGSTLPLAAREGGLLDGLDSRQARLCLGIVAVLCLLYVAFALTPSSYAMASQYLGLAPIEPLLGKARGIRMDEWMVYTPYVQIAVANDFGATNAFSPYHETLRSFQALPLLDWGLLFKPYHWAFFILPPANAYSFFFMFMAMAFLCGWALFLRQLRVPPLAAVLVALTLYFSPYVQVWWTTNWGAFALAPWVAVAWLRIDNRWLRILASAYALVVWLLAVAYPPFIISALLAMGVLVLAFRRDALTVARLLDAAVAGGLALLAFLGYFHEAIEIVRNTVYPGQRESAGGGVSPVALLTHGFPNLMTRGFYPLPAFEPSNACEIAVFSSLLPLFTAVLADWTQVLRWARGHRLSLGVLAAGIALVACWIFLPVPLRIGQLTGLSMVPPTRALLALGLLLNIGCAIVLVRGGVRLGRGRLLLLAALLLAGCLLKFAFGQGSFSRLHATADAWPLLCVGVLAFAARRPRFAAHPVALVLAVAALGNVLTNGLFNPVQSARPIFDMDRSAVLASMQARGARQAADGALVVEGRYGALLSGVGIPAVNHTLYFPQLAYFRARFPDMPEDRFNTTFNRYHHVMVSDVAEPRSMYADLVEVPAAAMLAAPAQPPAPPQP
ncbi:TPA: hypothetical protein UMV35_003075 [Stenotrophomonas maltophilia]|jgi:hypothetical protein|uniref:DUF7657 domain-containing protein n=1 Tax=Stenotrophomonas TaxID=40323 RepID=UPI00131090ED|nr:MULTISPECIES: hypothetical protein [Stenotrophomonas]MDH2023993.1 hypothetical protein [Stenotrophomonas sp. GD03680]HEL3750756.1 hypothetical protein [Stenotrophomonas maltophilia]HEL7729719.1 hypothetical protein [Stenotrophomonas maltophilia]